MEKEITKVKECLQSTFKSASDIFIDPSSGECEVKVSVDEFGGEISRRLFSNGVKHGGLQRHLPLQIRVQLHHGLIIFRRPKGSLADADTHAGKGY